MTRSNRELLRLSVLKDRAHQQGMERTNKWIFDALRVHNQELYRLVSSDLGRQVIERYGMGPFLQNPGSSVVNEIKAVMVNLGCSRDEAVQFILASMRNIQSASPSAARMTEALAHEDQG